MDAARVPLSQKDVEAMTGASSRQKLPNDKRAHAQEQIGARCAAHALAIADALGNKPLCVVTGPHRFGKSASLLPALANILRARGKSAAIVNGRDYEGESFTLESLPLGRFDVLIIDEVNSLMRTKEKTKDLLQLLHKRATAVVPVITHYAGYESAALYYARFWQEAESSISGKLADIVCLPQMIVAPEMAWELLSSYSSVRDETLRAQIVSYILDRVPLNPHVLLVLAGARSIADVKRIVRSRRRRLFQHALSLEEYRALERSLDE